MFAEQMIARGCGDGDPDYWAMIGLAFANPSFDPRQRLGDENLPISRHPYTERNYTLFALLAGVRNYAGIRPIAAPRGLPPDVSEGIKREAEEEGEDGHSHTWLTLQELEQADWDQIVTLQSDVSQHDYTLFQEVGRPPDQSDWRYYMPDSRPVREGYYRVSWKVYVRELCRDFLRAVQELRLVARDAPHEWFRIVFWFDN